MSLSARDLSGWTDGVHTLAACKLLQYPPRRPNVGSNWLIFCVRVAFEFPPLFLDNSQSTIPGQELERIH